MTFLQNYILERRLNKLIRQGHFEAPERFSNGVYTTYVCETFKLESKTPNDIHIVASVLSDLDGQYYYTPYKCVNCIARYLLDFLSLYTAYV